MKKSNDEMDEILESAEEFLNKLVLACNWLKEIIEAGKKLMENIEQLADGMNGNEKDCEPDPDLEFVCPDLADDEYPYVEVLYCESICLNRGCSKLKTCEAYKKAKELELTKKEKPTEMAEPNK